MFNYILKYRWALIGTVFIHLGVAMYMNYGVRLVRNYERINELQQIPMVIEEEKEMELLTEEEAIKQMQNGKVSNITVNERDKVGESDKKYDSRNYKNLASDVEKEVRDYEQNTFDEFAKKHKKDDPVIPDKNQKKSDNKNLNGSSDNDGGKVRQAGRVSGSYDLNGRRDERFLKPAYVCKGSGTVVLKVKVNHDGKVVSAQIDPVSSSYTEECMGENAVRYALKCKFEAGTQWPNPQNGTITYTYISQ